MIPVTCEVMPGHIRSIFDSKLTICQHIDISILTSAVAMTTQNKATPHLLTQVILQIFRVNGQLLEAGDQLVAPLKLTSSKWQVLGAVASQPSTMSQIARSMGLTRQSVQRTANILRQDGLLIFADNPDHKAAPVLKLSGLGARVLREATELQMAWSTELAAGQSQQDLGTMLTVLDKLTQALQRFTKEEKLNGSRRHRKAGK